jgi:hypothetical protein
MIWLSGLFMTLLSTLQDVIPIAVIIFGFQFLVLRQPIPHLRQVLIGFAYVLIGLTLFLEGLEQALFPLGRLMAEQLTNPDFIYQGIDHVVNAPHWADYYWVYATVYPIISCGGQEGGYLSCRRKASVEEIAAAEALYKTLH